MNRRKETLVIIAMMIGVACVFLAAIYGASSFLFFRPERAQLIEDNATLANHVLEQKKTIVEWESRYEDLQKVVRLEALLLPMVTDGTIAELLDLNECIKRKEGEK